MGSAGPPWSVIGLIQVACDECPSLERKTEPDTLRAPDLVFIADGDDNHILEVSTDGQVHIVL